MVSIDYELRYLQAGLATLEQYLLSSVLYWSLDVEAGRDEAPYPQFTLGNLLLFFQRADASEGHLDQAAQLSKAHQQLDAARLRWASAWKKKAAQEFKARLDLWRNFISEYRAQPEANDDRYRYEVSRRVILHLLQQETDQISPASSELLAGMDRYLAAVLLPGAFIWDAALQPGFPREDFWYLYGALPR